MIFGYSKLVDRQSIIFSSILPTLQKRVRQTNLIFAGCGLASMIAVLAARVGFSKFFLIDDDTVELSNLNRQSFLISDLGKKKVVQLKQHILNINPSSVVKTIDRRLGKETINSINDGIIINTIDYDQAFKEFLLFSSRKNLINVIPLNLPFSALSIVLGSRSSYQEFSKLIFSSELELLRELYKCNKSKFPRYLANYLQNINSPIFSNNPQSGIGASMVSSLVIMQLIKIISQQPGLYYPDIFVVDIS